MLYLLSLHFPEERIMVSINKYFYQEYFVEPVFDESKPKKHMEQLEAMFWGSKRFVSKYLKACCTSLTVEGSVLDEIIKECFPDLVPYLVNLRCLRDLHRIEAKSSAIDLHDFSFHLDAILPTDWTQLYHTAQLDENRRGLSIR